MAQKLRVLPLQDLRRSARVDSRTSVALSRNQTDLSMLLRSGDKAQKLSAIGALVEVVRKDRQELRLDVAEVLAYSTRDMDSEVRRACKDAILEILSGIDNASQRTKGSILLHLNHSMRSDDVEEKFGAIEFIGEIGERISFVIVTHFSDIGPREDTYQSLMVTFGLLIACGSDVERIKCAAEDAIRKIVMQEENRTHVAFDVTHIISGIRYTVADLKKGVEKIGGEQRLREIAAEKAEEYIDILVTERFGYTFVNCLIGGLLSNNPKISEPCERILRQLAGRDRSKTVSAVRSHLFWVPPSIPLWMNYQRYRIQDMNRTLAAVGEPPLQAVA